MRSKNILNLLSVGAKAGAEIFRGCYEKWPGDPIIKRGGRKLQSFFLTYMIEKNNPLYSYITSENEEILTTELKIHLIDNIIYPMIRNLSDEIIQVIGKNKKNKKLIFFAPFQGDSVSPFLEYNTNNKHLINVKFHHGFDIASNTHYLRMLMNIKYSWKGDG